jgi:protein-arginine kinase activator protein McsA
VDLKPWFSNLNSEIYSLNKDPTIMDYIKSRRNGSHHKNGRRIPKEKHEWEISQHKISRKTKKKMEDIVQREALQEDKLGIGKNGGAL